MSSATSTSTTVQLKPDAADGSVQASTFRASHFFILASLMAATGAVIMSRQSSPQHLVLISLTIATAGLAAAGFYRMLAPLVEQNRASASEPLSERARGIVERDKVLVLRALKDLEFDRAMGKVSAPDFDQMAARLRGRALSLMKQLDEDGTGYRTIIERELSARMAARAAERGRTPSPEVAVPEDAAQEPVSGLCICGTSNDLDAIFCKKCGTRLPGADSDAGTVPPR